MLSNRMSSALAAILVGIALLSGCVAQPPVESTKQDTENVISAPTVEQWLDQLEEVESMDTTEVMRQLELIDKTTSASQLFYYGILNQRLQNYGAWTVARDAFQQLQEDQTLTKQQRQLAAVLREYNQSRINGHARYATLLKEQSALQDGLNQAETEKRQLEQKIQALTELETTISTRQED